MDDDQQFCLRWNNHQSTLISVFDTLLENGTLVDCTLAAEGKFLKAHKVVLSACSPYFATLLSQQYDKHPIFILKDVKFQELRAMMDYMYRGEVNISQDQLAALLKAAESLQIKGLSDSRSGGNSIGGGGSGVGPKSAAEHKPLSVPVASAAMKGASPSGFTIEQKRPRHTIGGPSSIESQSGSREGSSSPTSRKRKKMRRRSIDNINADNHEHSNSSSQSMKINSSVPQSNTSATAITSVQSAVVSATQQQQQAAIGGSGGGAAAAAGSGLNVTKKTDSISSNTKLETTGTEHDLDTENGNEHDDNIGKSINARKEQNHKRKQHAADVDDGKDGGEILIEPKSEYEEGNDETVEDLTLDDEELLEDLDQAGPSHGGGEGSSQGYAQWQVDRSQDDVFMATQEAAGQQRDPQDLRTNINKSDGKPSPVKNVSFQQRKFSSPIVPNLSGMLLDFYQKNSLHIPKNNKFENFVHRTSSPPPYNTPLSVSTNHETELNLSISASSQQKTEKLLKAQTATNSLQSTTLRKNETDAIAKNDDLVSTLNCSAKKLAASYHPRIKYSNVNNKTTTPTVAIPSTSASSLPIPSISSTVIAAPVIQPPLIAPPPPPPPSAAAAIAAAAFFRGEYRNFHQLQAQEILNHQQSTHQPSSVPPTPPKNPPFYIPPPYMKNANSNDRSSENDDDSQSDDDHIDDDEDDDGKYPSIDDIHLIEGSKSGFLSQSLPPTENDYLSDESHKYSLMAAQALRNLEYSLSDYGGNGGEEQLYSCRHCGKKYRWKSTLRRHENVECGGKEPSHQCPYCPYKSKQRGNLGVHVRKHHSNLPQLASKRRSKYSQPRD